MQKNQFLKSVEVKDRKIKREIEELFLKLIILSIYDMDSFERKETNKIRPVNNT